MTLTLKPSTVVTFDGSTPQNVVDLFVQQSTEAGNVTRNVEEGVYVVVLADADATAQNVLDILTTVSASALKSEEYLEALARFYPAVTVTDGMSTFDVTNVKTELYAVDCFGCVLLEEDSE